MGARRTGRDRARILRRSLGLCLALAMVPTPGDALTVQESSASHQETSTSPETPAWLAGVGARLQLRHTWDHPEGSHTTAVQRGRVWARGAQDRFAYLVQVEMAGSRVHLLDADIATPLPGGVRLRVGQGKVPFGRQLLNSSGALAMVDRSIADRRFASARRPGVEISGSVWDARLHWAAGRFAARGIRDDPGIPGRSMTAGRVVATPLGPYPASESPLRIPDGPRLALGLAGLTNREDPGGEPARVARWNGEAALRVGRLQVVSEAFREERRRLPDPSGPTPDPPGSSSERVDAWGGYAQVGVLSRSLTHEVVVRYSWIRPEGGGRATEGSVPQEWEASQSETGIGYTLYLDGHRTKVQGDVHRLTNGATGSSGTRVRLQATVTLW